jgi:hypothetical protein
MSVERGGDGEHGTGFNTEARRKGDASEAINWSHARVRARAGASSPDHKHLTISVVLVMR